MQTIFVILSLIVSTLAAPEGYNYKSSAPVSVHGNLNGFQPIAVSGLPCAHSAHNTGDLSGAAAALIQSQSTGRIVNKQHGHHHVEHNLDTAASTVNSQSQAVTVNSHIVVGDNGPAASVITGASQEFQPTVGYVQAGLPSASIPVASNSQLPPSPQPSYYNPLPQLPPQLPAQPFNPTKIGNSQAYANTFSKQAATAQANHIHHHYTVPSTGIINGIGKVPPPPSYLSPIATAEQQYAAGYANNKFTAAQTAGFVVPPNRAPPQFAHPLPNRPLGPVLSAPIGNIGAPRPVPHFSSANQFSASNNFQQSSNAYASSFGHNAFGAQTGAAHTQFVSPAANAQYATSVGNTAAGSSFGAGSFNSGNIDFSSSSSNALNGQLGNIIRETFANTPLDPTVEKHIYVHVPPEDLEGSKHVPAQILQQEQPKKHYKIIFIKAPNAATPNYAQLAAATPQSEEKTIVYVLVKKPEEPSVEEIQQIQQSSIHSSKPEVYFIKYKTRKEGESLGPVYTGATQYNNANQLSTNSEVSATSNSNVIPSNENSIDIRYGSGESNSVGTSTSYSTSSSSSSSSSATSSTSVNSGPQHELYGVPLE